MRAALLSLLSASLVLGGCSTRAQQIGGQLRTGTKPTVVSLSPSATEVVATAIDSSLLVGRTSADDYPKNVVSVPVVASVKPDFEKIRSIKPTLVVYDADLYNEADVKRIEGMGAESFAFNARTVDDFEKQLYELGNKLGGETSVSGYVDRIEKERASAEGDRSTNPPKVVVILGGGPGAYVAGTGSFVADVVKIAGGTPVGPASDKFASMSPEAMVAAQPDVVVFATSKEAAQKDLDALKADPRLRTSPAVKNNRFIPIDASIATRRGYRVDTFIRTLHHDLAQAVQN